MNPGTASVWAVLSLTFVPTTAKSAMIERSGLKRFWVNTPAVDRVVGGGVGAASAFSSASMRRIRSSYEGVGLTSGAVAALAGVGMSVATGRSLGLSRGCASSKAVVRARENMTRPPRIHQTGAWRRKRESRDAPAPWPPLCAHGTLLGLCRGRRVLGRKQEHGHGRCHGDA